MLNLIIEDDEGRRTKVPLVRSEITIGRREGNTIRLTERNVSRTHARIFKENGAYFIEDRSRYGIRKNGKKFGSKAKFDQGDTFTIGDYKLLLRQEETEQPAPAEEFPSSDTIPAARPLVAGDTQVARIPGASSTPNPPAVAAPAPSARAATPIPAPAAVPAPAAPVATGPSVAATAPTPSSSTGPTPPGRFVCLSEPFAGSDFVFDRDEMVIGRGDECDLIVDHGSVSKRHARVVRSGSSYRVEDLGSSNGVVVNGERENSLEMRRGDVVELGSLRFRYVAPNEVFAYVPEEKVQAPGRQKAILIGAAAVVAVVLLIVAVMFGLNKPPRNPAAPPEVPPDQVAVPIEPVEPDAAADTPSLGDGQRSLAAGEWERAIEIFRGIPESDPNHELAQSLLSRAESELASRDVYHDVIARYDALDFQGALQRINELEVGSYYRTRVSDEGTERRILDAYIDQRISESQAAQDIGDLREARRIVEEIRPLEPSNSRINARIAQLDTLGSGGQPRPAPGVVDRGTPQQPQQPSPERPRVGSPDDPPRTVPPRTEEPRTEEPAPPEPDASTAEPVPSEPAEDPVARAQELKSQARRVGIQQNHREAIRLLEEARELNPGDPEINLMLFSNYRAIGNVHRAALAIGRYLQQRPNDPRRGEFEQWLQENAAEEE